MIAPTGLIRRYCTTGYHLVLAHLVLQDEEYAELYREVPGFKILDNSVIELGRPLSTDELLEAAKKVNADEIVIPDYIKDADKTIDSAYKYGEELTGYKLMAVPQGQDPREWYRCYKTLQDLPFISTFGIPKSLKEDRVQICHWINREIIMTQGQKWDYHILGTFGNPIEVAELAEYDWIRGVDSKIPVRAGQLGILFDKSRGLLANRDDMPPLDFGNADDPIPMATVYNIRTFRIWANNIRENVVGLEEMRTKR